MDELECDHYRLCRKLMTLPFATRFNQKVAKYVGESLICASMCFTAPVEAI